VVTPLMRARLVMCAACGDVPILSVMRWLPPGTTEDQLRSIGSAWRDQRPGDAWAMAHQLVGNPSPVLGAGDRRDTHALSFSLPVTHD
jgi:hypothetical protein